MDPLTIFPPEIVHQIWRYLEPRDLLACRAVASHWLASVGDCAAAWVTDFSHDWTEYLEVKKVVRGWSTANIRRQTISNVRAYLFTEFAYYLVKRDGCLEMFSPAGMLIRKFHRPATDLHRGSNCLLIGVDNVQPNSSKIKRRTIITDFALNYIDDMDVEILKASPKGYSYIRNGEYFFSIGPEIPAVLSVPFRCAELFFLTSSVISVEGFTVPTVRFFNPETSKFSILKSSTSSPRWIPSVKICLGPEDYFGLIVQQRDFNSIFVYNRDNLLFENSYSNDYSCLFTDDYFIISVIDDSCTAFKLKNFEKSYKLDLSAVDHITNIICEPWSLFKNTVAVFERDAKAQILRFISNFKVYRLHDSPNTNSECCEPELRLFTNNPEHKTLWGPHLYNESYKICPRYGFKCLANHSLVCGAPDFTLDILYFELFPII